MEPPERIELSTFSLRAAFGRIRRGLRAVTSVLEQGHEGLPRASGTGREQGRAGFCGGCQAAGGDRTDGRRRTPRRPAGHRRLCALVPPVRCRPRSVDATGPGHRVKVAECTHAGPESPSRVWAGPRATAPGRVPGVGGGVYGARPGRRPRDGDESTRPGRGPAGGAAVGSGACNTGPYKYVGASQPWRRASVVYFLWRTVDAAGSRSAALTDESGLSRAKDARRQRQGTWEAGRVVHPPRSATAHGRNQNLSPTGPLSARGGWLP